LLVIWQNGHIMVFLANERQFMLRIADYIQELQQRGRYHFTTKDAVTTISGGLDSVVRALSRLKSKGKLATPQRGFYVVIPPEYISLGCLPAEQFVPQLMEHLGEPYHVALLSAAQLYGAAHQRPQRFQVMVQKPRKSIICGKVHVDFFVRGDLKRVSTVIMNTPRGQMLVSSPETTALELVGYKNHAGGLNNVATILVELAETIAADKLANEALHAPLAWVQRLGFLLELVEQNDTAKKLLPLVQQQAQRVTPLDSTLPRTGAKRSSRWRVAINVQVEPDL
jgi:predicted transcriptional regulator of viral defense system